MIIFISELIFMNNTIKRMLDISISLCALIFGAPIFIITAIFIFLDSPGPILYSQPRVGLKGNTFRFWKFRSMVTNADEILFKNKDLYKEMRTGSHKIKNDPRITKVGSFIRKWSIDELPQFWNVLVGDMSFVGPRAYRPDEYELYLIGNEEIGVTGHPQMKKYIDDILSVRPGITGSWQVSGRSSITFDERVKMDAKYANEWTVCGDILIILKTPLAVIKGEGVM